MALAPSTERKVLVSTSNQFGGISIDMLRILDANCRDDIDIKNN